VHADDNADAVAALAARIRADDDELELLWLAYLATTVDHPTPELADAVFDRFQQAHEQGNAALFERLYASVAHCGGRLDAQQVRLALARQHDHELWRVLLALAALAPEDEASLLAELSAVKINLPDYAKMLDLLALRGPQARPAVPHVVELLENGYDERIAKTLRAIDPEGKASRAYVGERLTGPNLSQDDRQHFAFLQLQLDLVFGPRE
jgi:hypothetical protein